MLDLGFRVGADQQDHPLRPGSATGPDLLPVDHVFITFALAAALQGSEVGADVGFRVSSAPLVFGVQNVGDESLFLLLGSVLDNARSNPGQSHEARAERGCATGRHFLFEDHLLGDGTTAATDVLGPGVADPSLVADLAIPLLHESRIVFVGIGWQVGVQKFADFLSERLFFFGKFEIHQIPPSAAARS